MNQVHIINLAGRAYHVEVEGSDAIKAWLKNAKQALNSDPDCAEIIKDFELAIAERCEAVAPEARDVVTTEQAQALLEALGPVEPAPLSTPIDTDDPDTQPTEKIGLDGGDTPLRDRRLYRVTGDQAMIAGVCAGLAVYLRLDVTVIRVLWVILTFATSGFAALIYVVMALMVPEEGASNTPDNIRGYGKTAQQIIADTKQHARPALQQVGQVFAQVGRASALVIEWLFVALIWLTLFAWGVLIGWVFLSSGHFEAIFSSNTSRWTIALWLTCLFWVALPILFMMRGFFGWLSGQKKWGYSQAKTAAGSLVWVLAIAGSIAIPALHTDELRAELKTGVAKVELFGQEVCIYNDGSARGIASCDEHYERLVEAAKNR